MKYTVARRVDDVVIGISQHKTKKDALKALRRERMLYKKSFGWASPIYVNRFFNTSFSHILVQIMETGDFYGTQTLENYKKWKSFNWVESQDLPQD